jgi:peptide/nickel transport system substrate-binding protein
MSPEEFAPVNQVQLQWPKWGQHFETSAKAGEPPDLPAAQELMRLYEAWIRAATRAEREQIWHRLLTIHADEVFTIGVVSGVRQPVIVRNTLKNVPQEAIYNWNPGAQFGIYQPDTFWFDE